MSVKALVVEEAGGAAAVAQALAADPDFVTVTAGDLDRVLDAIQQHEPDLLVLIPAGEASALRAIARVMAQLPVPILVLARDGVWRDRALKAGAVDVLPVDGLDEAGRSALRTRARAISTVPVIRHIKGRGPASARAVLPIVGIAASTGGPQAVAAILRGLGGLSATVLVVQHMHADFMPAFVEWMDRECPLPVQLADDGRRLEPGRVYLAPANVHLKVGPLRSTILTTEPESLHRPSANVLFTSIAEHAGRNGIGVLLTGMGDDGALGLLAIRQAGGRTFAQDEASSAIYGMPRAAENLGAVERVLPVDAMAEAIHDAAEALV